MRLNQTPAMLHRIHQTTGAFLVYLPWSHLCLRLEGYQSRLQPLVLPRVRLPRDRLVVVL